MGCCCLTPPDCQVEPSPSKHKYEQEIPNLSKVQIINDKQTLSPNQATKYRQEGKIYFNSRQFGKAQQAYKLALECDIGALANYTNLALVYKMLGKYVDSIDVIDKMEKINVKDENDFVYVVKGRIIKARCQTILAKQYWLNQKSTQNSLLKSQILLTQSIKALKSLQEFPRSSQLALRLNSHKFLQNAMKISRILSPLREQQKKTKNFSNYLTTKLNSKQAVDQFKNSPISKYYSQPYKVIEFVSQLENQVKKKSLLEAKYQDQEQEEQFTIDPITYEQFSSPILVRSGLTYQEETLKKHYSNNGSFDPITREKFQNQLGVKNNTLMAYIQQTKSKKKSNLDQIKLLQL